MNFSRGTLIALQYKWVIATLSWEPDTGGGGGGGGGLTDTELRATPVAVSFAAAPLTPNSPAVVSVGTSSGVLVASNSARTGLVITNTSDNQVSLGLAAAAVLGSGITLEPGAIWTMSPNTLVIGAINAIAAGASSAVAVQEFQ